MTLQRAGTSLTAEGRAALTRLFAQIEADLRRFDPTGVAKRYQALRRDKFFRELSKTVREWVPEYDAIQKNAR